MPFRVFVAFIVGLCFSSCAVHGVVVNKSFQPLPPAHGDAAEGIYRLTLRGADQVVHRQLVTRAVFATYQIGDEFSAEVPARIMAQRNLAKRERADTAARMAQLGEDLRHRNAGEAARGTEAHLSLQPEMLPETEAF